MPQNQQELMGDARASRKRYAPHFAPAHDFLFHLSDDVQGLPRDPPPLLKRFIYDTLASRPSGGRNPPPGAKNRNSGAGVARAKRGGEDYRPRDALPPIVGGGPTSTGAKSTAPAQQQPQQDLAARAYSGGGIGSPRTATDEDKDKLGVAVPNQPRPITSPASSPCPSTGSCSCSCSCSCSACCYSSSSLSHYSSADTSSSRTSSSRSRRRRRQERGYGGGYASEERMRSMEALMRKEETNHQEVLAQMKDLQRQLFEMQMEKSSRRQVWRGQGKRRSGAQGEGTAENEKRNSLRLQLKRTPAAGGASTARIPRPPPVQRRFER